MSRLDNKEIMISTEPYMCHIDMYRKCIINNIEQLMLFCLKVLKGHTHTFGQKYFPVCNVYNAIVRHF